MRTAEMLALFDEAESGIFTLQEKFIEFADYFLDVTNYSGPSPKNKIRYGNFADFVDMVFQPVTFSGVLYIYDAESGLFRPGLEEVRSFVQHKLSLFAGAAVCDRFSLLPPTLKLSRETDEVCRQVAALHVVSGDRSPFNQFRGIPAANGVVVFDEGGKASLVPYSPDMMFTRKIPVAYHADADTSAAVSLLRSWAGDDYGVLVQIAAQAFLQAFPDCAPFKKAYIIHGGRNSGKSSYLSFLEEVFGHSQVSHVALQALSERFNGQSLDGMFLNTCDDLSSASLKDAGIFKQFTGKEWHDVEPKGLSRYRARISAVHVFACNRFPRLPRDVQLDDAFWDRWVVLSFPGSYRKSSSWSSSVVPGALCGFLRLCVEEVSRILENGGELRFCPEAEAMREAWLSADVPSPAIPVSVFLERYTVRDAEGEVLKEEFVPAFTSWAAGNVSEFSGKVPRTVTAVTQALKRLDVDADWVGSGSARRAVYRGIRWRDEVSFTDDGLLVVEEAGRMRGEEGRRSRRW